MVKPRAGATEHQRDDARPVFHSACVPPLQAGGRCAGRRGGRRCRKADGDVEGGAGRRARAVAGRRQARFGAVRAAHSTHVSLFKSAQQSTFLPRVVREECW